MTNKQIIENITRYCINKEDPLMGNTEIVYTILSHSYLFVKPGEESKNLMYEIVKSLTQGVAEGINNYFEGYSLANIEDFIFDSTARIILNVVRKFFDADYFDDQCVCLDENEEEYSVSLLDKYIIMLKEKSLREFMDIIGFNSEFLGFFQNTREPWNVNKIINNHCRKYDSSIPSYEQNFKEYIEFITCNPSYMFEYMCKEDVAKIFRKSITKDLILAGNMAKALYYSNDSTLVDTYARMASTLKNLFGVDIYKPKVPIWDFYKITEK